MDTAFKYDKPFAETNLYKDTVGFWKETMDQYDAGKYKESIISFLNYLNPELVKSKGKNDNKEFVFPHGSLLINFTITDDFFEIKAPFLKIPQNRLVIFLRQISELNFSTMVLTQLICENDILYFYYKAPLSLCYPYKMWDLFYEICINGDYYDDKFINELQAQRVNEPEIVKYSPQKLDEIWNIYQEILDYGIKGCEDYQTKRIFNTGIDHGFITLMKLAYVLAPQGIISNYIFDFFVYRNDLSVEENLQRVIANLNKMKSIDRKIFDESIYQTQFLIPVKSRAELESIQNVLKPDYENAKEDIGVSNFLSAGYYLLYRFYSILYSYNIPRDIEKLIVEAIKSISGKDWKDVSKHLYNVTDKIMNMK